MAGYVKTCQYGGSGREIVRAFLTHFEGRSDVFDILSRDDHETQYFCGEVYFEIATLQERFEV